MNLAAYEFDILHATTARDLHTLRNDIVCDDLLTSDEKETLLETIRRKFAQLNAAANRNPKGYGL